MPIDVAVEEPRARVIRKEADCDIVAGVADVHDVAEDRVIIIVSRVTGTAYDGKRMSMQVNGMLFGEGIIQIGEALSPDCQRRILTGPPTTPAGILSSTLLLAPRP